MSFLNDFWFWVAVLAVLGGIYYASQRRRRAGTGATSLDMGEPGGHAGAHVHGAAELPRGNEPPPAMHGGHMATRDTQMQHDHGPSGGQRRHGCC